MTRKNDAERQDAIEKLRGWITPGDTVYTVLDSVSRSGMSRTLRVVLLSCEHGRAVDLHPNWAVGKALGLRHAKRNGREQDGLVVGGCGMDMGFHVVYSLAATLWPEGFGCVGKDCPSNDHSNGDRDHTPHNGITGCQQQVCVCHDASAWTDPNAYPNGCSSCGCHRTPHWHRDGGYALRHRWL